MAEIQPNWQQKRLRGRYKIIKDYDSKATMCVYCIESLTTGRCYIGATSMKMMFRVNSHFKDLRNNKHRCAHLQHTYNACGEGDFKVSILYKDATTLEILNILEGVYCEIYRATNKEFGFNTQIPGGIKKHSEETKAKMRASWTDERKIEKSKERKKWHSIYPIQAPIITDDIRRKALEATRV